MSNRNKVDFDAVIATIETVEKMILNGLDVEQIKNLQPFEMREGYLLIATQPYEKPDGEGNVHVKKIVAVGGMIDPVAHQLAQLLLEQPLLRNSVYRWLHILKNSPQ